MSPDTPKHGAATFPSDRIGGLYLSGKVVTDNGMPPPDSAVIERVCGGIIRREAYTDPKGRFSFQIGQDAAAMADASEAGSPRVGPMAQAGGTGGMPVGNGMIGERALMNCEIRASLPGYRSASVALAGRRYLDDPDLGTIIIHRMANVEGTTFSAISAMAPKDAKKAYEKGREQARKKKWDQAKASLEKAVGIYPKYAAAWFELGLVYEEQQDFDRAGKAYTQALTNDPKYLYPYLPMALLEARERKWQAVSDTTDHLIRLDPADYPEAYYYNAVSNLNMKKLEPAEKSARRGIEIDTGHKIPQMRHVLGIILAEKRDFTGAEQQMKDYLALAPDARDADAVRKQIAEVERLSSANAAPAPHP